MKLYRIAFIFLLPGCAYLAPVKDFFKKPIEKRDPDRDGVLDEADYCPNTYGLASNHGCPLDDRDGDGLRDDLDTCPDAFGLLQNNGCPGADSDADGLADEADACPDVPGSSSQNGCPDADADGDGLADAFDQCPNTPGAVAKGGCPAPNSSDQALLERSLSNLFFENEKPEVRPESYRHLDRLAELMIKKRDWRLRISGHPDDAMKAPAKISLAKSRSEAVKSYLIGRGVRSAQLHTEYYLTNQPFRHNWVEMEFYWD